MSGTTDFDREAAARVLRRAVELAERDAGPRRPDGVSEQALVEAAEELGVDPTAVRRAAAEERLGVLHGAVASRVDRVAGPASVSVTRVVALPAAEAMDVVDQWLRRNGTLRRRRLDEPALVAEYARRSDLLAGLQRSVRSVRGQEHLGRVRRLRVVVEPSGPERAVVAMVADLELERTAALTGGGSIAGVGSSWALVEAIGSSAWWWAGVPASLAAGLGVVRWRARSVPDVEVALQGVLDRVAADDLGGGVIADVRERLRAGWPRPGRTAGAGR